MTQAEHPVQSPDVTTSVKSSFHCGFSGGIGPPYSAAGHRSGTVGSVPEILEVELYRRLAEKELWRPIEKVWMIDARYGRGGTTPRRLQSALAGHVFTEARRRGKLLLLDTDRGPTLGVRFGMTGGLVVDGTEALDRLLYGPGVFGEKWVRARFPFAAGGHLLLHAPRRFGSLELGPDEARLGPDALSVGLADFRAALASNPAR